MTTSAHTREKNSRRRRTYRRRRIGYFMGLKPSGSNGAAKLTAGGFADLFGRIVATRAEILPHGASQYRTSGGAVFRGEILARRIIYGGGIPTKDKGQAARKGRLTSGKQILGGNIAARYKGKKIPRLLPMFKNRAIVSHKSLTAFAAGDASIVSPIYSRALRDKGGEGVNHCGLACNFGFHFFGFSSVWFWFCSG